jgi:hypothetical protein
LPVTMLARRCHFQGHGRSFCPQIQIKNKPIKAQIEQRHNILSERVSRNGVQRTLTASSAQPGLNAGECSQEHVFHVACEEPRSNRHASHPPASLQWKTSRSVPSPGYVLGDDRKNFQPGFRPWRAPGLITKRTPTRGNVGHGSLNCCQISSISPVS